MKRRSFMASAAALLPLGLFGSGGKEKKGLKTGLVECKTYQRVGNRDTFEHEKTSEVNGVSLCLSSSATLMKGGGPLVVVTVDVDKISKSRRRARQYEGMWERAGVRAGVLARFMYELDGNGKFSFCEGYVPKDRSNAPLGGRGWIDCMMCVRGPKRPGIRIKLRYYYVELVGGRQSGIMVFVVDPCWKEIMQDKLENKGVGNRFTASYQLSLRPNSFMQLT